jgi:hypothetical protein
LIERGIAVDSTDTEKLDTRIVSTEEKGVCVLSDDEYMAGECIVRLTSCPVSFCCQYRLLRKAKRCTDAIEPQRDLGRCWSHACREISL